MSAYEYVALTQGGQQKKGVLEGESSRQIRHQLREQHLIPLEITPIISGTNKNKTTAKKLTYFSGVKIEELSLITRQLATLISAAIPVEEALHTVAMQASKSRIKAMIMALRAKVMEGYALSAAMEAYSKVFNELYRYSVAAGEQSGHLSEVLERLADHVEQQHASYKKVQNALVYPIMMVVVSLGIVAFLLTYVVPNIVEVFSDNDQTLPLMTAILLNISDGVQAYGLYGFIGVLLFISLWFRLMKYPVFTLKVHRYLLPLPIIGRIIRLVNCSRFFHTLGMLRCAGVPILEAMQVAVSLVSNRYLRQAVKVVGYQVREGVSLSKALAETKIFPILSIHLIASGEKSGNLDDMLIRSANYHQQEVNGLIDTSIALFEPIMILTMGSIVLFIVLAILLPIFSLDQLAAI